MLPGRALLYLLFMAPLLPGQVDLHFEIRLRAGTSEKPALVRKERYLYQGDVLRIESGDVFILYHLKANRVVIGNGKEQSYAEGTPGEFLELVRKSTPQLKGAQSNVKVSASVLPEPPPPVVWQGQTVAGQTCRVTTGVDVPGTQGRSLSFEHRIDVYSIAIPAELAAAHEARASIGLADSDQPMAGMSMPGFAETSACFPKDRMPVKVELSMKGTDTALPVDVAVTYEVTRLATGPLAPSLFSMPDGWKTMDGGLPRAWAAYTAIPALVAAVSTIRTPIQTAEPGGLSKKDLLKLADAVKRLIEAEDWEAALRDARALGSAMLSRAEAAKPPLSKQLADLEAKIARMGPRDAGSAEIRNAAELSLKIGDIQKVATYARMLTTEPPPGEFGYISSDDRHDGHTLLGLLAWQAGDREVAYAHLEAAAKNASGPLTGAFGARMELAEKLVAAREFARVASYVEACGQGASRPQHRTMYERALEALRANTRPYLPVRYDRYEMPPPAAAGARQE